MKKIIYIFFFSLLLMQSCEVLNVEPTQSVPADEAINDLNGLERTLIGSYDAMQSAGYYGRDFLITPDLASDNLEWTGTTAGYNQIDNNTVLSDNVIIEGVWASIYTAINRVNYVIEAVPQLPELTTQQRQAYNGEAHFLRALHHFNLVQLFGGVPVRTSPVSANESDLNIARSSIENVYAQIFNDLVVARQANTATQAGRAGREAAVALSARVFLHWYAQSNQTTALDSAIYYSEQLINGNQYELAENFASLFDGSENNEIIFEVAFSAQDRNRLAEYFFTRNLSGRKEFSPTASLINSYDAADTMRLNATVAVAADGPYGIKYNDIGNGTDRVPVLRLAEMYLIHAEATALKGGDASTVREGLNAIRLRAGLTPATSDDLQTLLASISQERRLEFALEGHRWFELVRTGQISELFPDLQSCFYLFPIPLSEIQANESISSSDQNPCY